MKKRSISLQGSRKKTAENFRGERTVALVKPDGVKRGLIGEVISRFERRGLKIIALKMVKPTREHIDNHYPKDPKWIERLGHKGIETFDNLGLRTKDFMGTDEPKKIGRDVRRWLIKYMSSAPVVAMIIEGVDAVNVVRKVCGSTKPSEAEIGTIRGDFSIDSPTSANTEKRAMINLVHASETKEEAKHEIDHWFSPEDIHGYVRADHLAMFGEI